MLVTAIIACAIWTLMAVEIIRNCIETKQLKAYEGTIAADCPTVEVVIPALNEELRVADTIEKILGQDYPHMRITVVNDRSTDRTGEILEELAKTKPIHVIHGQPRPPGWVGKTWAIVQGTKGTQADWLLFVDADMGLHPRALATAMHQAEQAGADVVSIIARPEIETFWQGAIAVALGEVLFTMYPTHKVNDPQHPLGLVAGGFLLVRRSAYESIGGHEAVRAEIVEDIKIGQALKKAGYRLSVHFSPDLAWTHMYGTFRDLWVGLRKNAFAGMEYNLGRYLVGASGGQIMAWAPIIATVLGVFTASWPLMIAGICGVLAQAISVAPMIPYLRISPLFVFAIPPGSAAYTAIATASVWNHYRGRIIWKGVTFSAKEVREAGRLGPGPVGGAEEEATTAAGLGHAAPPAAVPNSRP